MRFWTIMITILICQEALAVTGAQISYILEDKDPNLKNAYFFNSRGILNKLWGRNDSISERNTEQWFSYYSQIYPDGKETIKNRWHKLFHLNTEYGTRRTIHGSKSNGYILAKVRNEGEFGGDFQVVRLDKNCKIKERSKWVRGPILPNRYEFDFAEDDDCLYIVYHQQMGGPVVGPDLNLYFATLYRDTLINKSVWETVKPICDRKFYWYAPPACLLVDNRILIGSIVSREYTHYYSYAIQYSPLEYEKAAKQVIFFMVDPEGRIVRKTKISKIDEIASKKYPLLLFNMEMVRLSNGQIAVYIPVIEDGKTYVYEIHLTSDGDLVPSKDYPTEAAKKITDLPEGRWAKVHTYLYYDKSGHYRRGVIIYGFDGQGNLYYHHGNMAGWSK